MDSRREAPCPAPRIQPAPPSLHRSSRNGRHIRQCIYGLRTNTVAVTASGSWSIYRWGWQFSGSQVLDEAYVPFLGAFGAAWDDAMVARWSANPLGMLWPELDAALVTSGGNGGGDPPAVARRLLVIVAAG